MIQSLECRLLFSATVEVIDDVLTVIGTDADDRIIMRHVVEHIDDDFVPMVRIWIDDEPPRDFADELFQSMRIEGHDGDDIIHASGLRPKLIRAGSGNDEVEAGGGLTTIYGQGGRDTLIGGDWPDSIMGGNGNDNIFGGRGDDVLKGQGGNDVIEGSVGHDTLRGGDGDDVLRGQQGNDRLDGDGGADRLRGGSGTDLLIAWELDAAIADDVNGGDHDDRARVDELDTLVWIENIVMA